MTACQAMTASSKRTRWSLMLEALPWVLALFPLAAIGQAQEGLVFSAPGRIRARSDGGNAAGGRTTWGGAVYWATFPGAKARVVRISPADQDVKGLTVASSGRVVWVIDGERGGSTLKTVSYPDLKVREHPRAVPPYRSGWVVLAPDGRALAYPVWTPVDPQGRRRQLTLEEQREFYSRPGQSRPRTDIHCEDLETGRARVVSGNWAVLRSPVWSPDGKRMAFYAFASTREDPGSWLWVVDIATSETRRLAGPTKFIGIAAPKRKRFWSKQWAPVWSRDGNTVFFNARYGDDPESGFIYQVDAHGESKPARVSSGRCIGTTPEGDAIYVHRGKEVFLLSLKGKQIKTSLLSRPQGYWYPKVSPSGAWVAHHDFTSMILVASLRGARRELAIPDVTGPTSSYHWVHALAPVGKLPPAQSRE